MTPPPANVFAETPLVRRKLRQEALAKWIFCAMAALMILPLILIIGYLFERAWPSLSLSFLLEVPSRGMRAGGVWPAFVGTIYLVFISLAVSAPIGILAAVYLNEYASDNWLNRLINLAVINLAGVPSIVHALFGLGAFVYAAKVARQPYALSLGPSTVSVTLSSGAVVQGQPATLIAAVSDAAYGTHPQSVGRPTAQAVVAAEAYVGAPAWAGGTPIALAAQDGAFDSPTELVTGVLDTTNLSVGRHLVFVRGRNAAGAWGPVTAQWLTVWGDRVLYFPIVGR